MSLNSANTKTDPITKKQLSFSTSRSNNCLQIDSSHHSQNREWLVSPLFDLLFVCGIAPWLLGISSFLIVSLSLNNNPSILELLPALTIIFIAASILIGESHQFTSILRYYGDFRQRDKQFVLSRMPLWIIYGCLVVAFLVFAQPWIETNLRILNLPIVTTETIFALTLSTAGPTVAFLVTVFPVFLLQHFCGQARAIGNIYCRINNYNLSKRENFLISLTAWLLVAAGACTIASPFHDIPFVISPQIFATMSTPLTIMASISTLLLATYFALRGLFLQEWLPIQTTLIWSNLFLFFILPFNAMINVWLFIPLLFHATQHWAVAWKTRQDERKEMGLITLSGFNALIDATRMMLPVQLATICVLFWPMWFTFYSTGVNSSTNPSNLTIGVLLSMLVFYIHYFSDRMVWRSR